MSKNTNRTLSESEAMARFDISCEDIAHYAEVKLGIRAPNTDVINKIRDAMIISPAIKRAVNEITEAIANMLDSPPECQGTPEVTARQERMWKKIIVAMELESAKNKLFVKKAD